MGNDRPLRSARSAAGGRLLAVLAKFWTPGQVKTRLAATVGSDEASDLHRQFVAATLCRLASAGDSRWLVASPAEAIPEFRRLPAAIGGDWLVVPQGEGDLGQRLKRIFGAAFAAGYEGVVALGSDSPDLPLELLDQAFHELRQVPVVLGPSTDGGYYMIGAAGAAPPIFEDMPWSSSSLLKATIERLEQNGLRFSLLSTWRDVDDFADLVALHERLSQPGVELDAALDRLHVAVARMVGSLVKPAAGA